MLYILNLNIWSSRDFFLISSGARWIQSTKLSFTEAYAAGNEIVSHKNYHQINQHPMPRMRPCMMQECDSFSPAAYASNSQIIP